MQIFKICYDSDITLVIVMMILEILKNVCVLIVLMFFILFYRPAKTDVCDTCTVLEKSMEVQPQNKARLQTKLDQHKEEAKKQQHHLSEREKSCPTDDKKPGDAWITIATDLQQTQPVPRLVNQSAYYKKKVRFPIRFIFF